MDERIQVMEAVDSLYSEFRSIDNLVAHNTTRVLNAYQNAQVASQVSKTNFNGVPFIFSREVN